MYQSVTCIIVFWETLNVQLLLIIGFYNYLEWNSINWKIDNNIIYLTMCTNTVNYDNIGLNLNLYKSETVTYNINK